MEDKTPEDATQELKIYTYTADDVKLLVPMMYDTYFDVYTRLWVCEGLIENPDHPLDRMIDKVVERDMGHLKSRPDYGYQCLKDAFKRNHKFGVLFCKPFNDMPLYINRKSHVFRIFSKWRLKIGK